MKNIHIQMNARPPLFSLEDPFKVKDATTQVKSIWKWGSDNLLPDALTALSRSSTIHRRILNDKADYIAGRGFTLEDQNPTLEFFINSANGQGESLRWVVSRIAFDKTLFGNAFLEVVTDQQGTLISIYHQDATKCRLAKDSQHVVLHHNWRNYTPQHAKVLPLYPNFELQKDGTLRSVIHYKDYEPDFEHYGVPKYIAAIQAATIAYKADRWNISRLDNAFQPSGVMVLDGEVDSSEEAQEIASFAEAKFAGKPGQVMFMVKNGVDGDTTKFVPITSENDGDWQDLHSQAMGDIIIAHSWFRTLSGIDYSTGFSSDRIQYEFDIAMNLVISGEQREILEPLITLLEHQTHTDCSSLQFVNKPPFNSKPDYLYVWEARRDDGLPYDSEDPKQMIYLKNI
ncbi:MAG: phage portal protein [Rikenellaceae bacterium]